MNSAPFFQDTVQLGGLVLPRGGLISLHGAIGAGVAYQRSGLRKANSNSGYQVPVGKKFRVVGIIVYQINTAVGYPVVGYCDNDCGMYANVTPTNPVYIAHGTISPVAMIGLGINSGFILPGFEVPAGKYLYFYESASVAAGSVCVVGYEEPA